MFRRPGAVRLRANPHSRDVGERPALHQHGRQDPPEQQSEREETLEIWHVRHSPSDCADQSVCLQRPRGTLARLIAAAAPSAPSVCVSACPSVCLPPSRTHRDFVGHQVASGREPQPPSDLARQILALQYGRVANANGIRRRPRQNGIRRRPRHASPASEGGPARLDSGHKPACAERAHAADQHEAG